jgi:hypothetical protein
MTVDITNMTQEKWDKLSYAQREELRDLSGLTQQLIGLEGCRVEVVDDYDKKRRFIVGRSTGWRPCHIELKTIRSQAGVSADEHYKQVTGIKRVRPARNT